VFKFIDERNDLQDYYLEISRHQELHCVELFWEKGLKGRVQFPKDGTFESSCNSPEATFRPNRSAISM